MPKTFALAVMMLTLAGCIVSAQSVTSIETKKDDLILRLSLEKTQFVEGEPIVGTVTLINGSDQSRVLMDPSIEYRIAGISARQVSGVSAPVLPGGHADIFGPPDNYGWLYKPAEAHSDQYDVQLDYARPLPVGTYDIWADYGPVRYQPSGHKDAWIGSMITGCIRISVVAPGPAETKAAGSFKAALMQYKQADRSAESLKTAQSLSALPTSSVFSKYAGFFEAMGYFSAQQEDAGITALRRYLAANEKAPYYGKRAVQTLADHLFRKKFYVEARQFYSKLPDGFDKAYMIKRCDDLIAAQDKTQQ